MQQLTKNTLTASKLFHGSGVFYKPFEIYWLLTVYLISWFLLCWYSFEITNFPTLNHFTDSNSNSRQKKKNKKKDKNEHQKSLSPLSKRMNDVGNVVDPSSSFQFNQFDPQPSHHFSNVDDYEMKVIYL